MKEISWEKTQEERSQVSSRMLENSTTFGMESSEKNKCFFPGFFV